MVQSVAVSKNCEIYWFAPLLPTLCTLFSGSVPKSTTIRSVEGPQMHQEGFGGELPFLISTLNEIDAVTPDFVVDWIVIG